MAGFVAGESHPEGWLFRLERAEMPVQLALDPERGARRLFFGATLQPIGDTAAHLREIAALPDAKAVLVESDGRMVATCYADTLLAVGSVFKPSGLAALADVRAVERLSDIHRVAMELRWRSLP
jgi:hypothetical protein